MAAAWWLVGGNLRNVVTVLCAPDDPLLPNASVDRVITCETWHHINGHGKHLALLKRMLKPRVDR